MSPRSLLASVAALSFLFAACGSGRSVCVRQCEKQESCARSAKQSQGEVPVGDMHSMCNQLCQGAQHQDEDVSRRVEGCLSRPCEQYDACIEAALRP